jgi:hypothetical protein
VTSRTVTLLLALRLRLRCAAEAVLLNEEAAVALVVLVLVVVAVVQGGGVTWLEPEYSKRRIMSCGESDGGEEELVVLAARGTLLVLVEDATAEVAELVRFLRRHDDME